MLTALDIWVKGIVQGVGFRPFVYRLAKRHLVNGWVLNGADGVHIHAEGDEKLVDEFVLAISEEAPVAAQVKEIEMHEVPLQGFDTFEIRMSEDTADDERTLVSPDLATCEDCTRELFDPENRRFRYPFINCTNCGPRFTIIDELPYDRPATSMREFPMCEECAAEYADPADRRFHAQPDACFTCGPVLSFAWRQTNEVNATATSSASSSSSGFSSRNEVRVIGLSHESDALDAIVPVKHNDKFDLNIAFAHTREETDAIFAEAVGMLCAGKILAVKGLGGYHLVCDANNADAVAELRVRKRRPGKAFAVMCESLNDAERICRLNDAERKLLDGSARPIVLLRKLPGVDTPQGIADGLPELGIMLPYTPVQHILLHDFVAAGGGSAAGRVPMLVMTSGNLHDEPIVISNEEAYEKLGSIADAFLGNNREILSRFDDSVVRVLDAPEGEAIQFIRRARGYAPVPIMVQPEQNAAASDAVSVLNEADGQYACETILAVGPEQKNTFTFLRGAEAFVSQHIGDVENAETFDAWLHAKERYEKLFDLSANALACDLHPEYITSKWAHEHAQAEGLPLVEVQHHHAHIASVLGEHHLPDAVCGIAFDGTGYGPDGAIWGGEVLLSNTSDFERFANFAYVPMPGGQACVKHPLRMAYGVLWEYDLLEHPAAQKALQQLGDEQAQVCAGMIEAGLNTPYTSSVGRLFDAASALLGICTQPTYEGEPAIMLEAAIYNEADNMHGAAGSNPAAQEGEASEAPKYDVAVVKNTATAHSTAHDTSVVLFDAQPTFAALLDDLQAGTSIALIAQRFHDAICDAILLAAQLVDAAYGIRIVALSGGVFMNRYLTQRAMRKLSEAGFTVAINQDLPPNDGCISFGQALVASNI